MWNRSAEMLTEGLFLPTGGEGTPVPSPWACPALITASHSRDVLCVQECYLLRHRPLSLERDGQSKYDRLIVTKSLRARWEGFWVCHR